MHLILENSNFQTSNNIIVPIPMNRKIKKAVKKWGFERQRERKEGSNINDSIFQSIEYT